MATRFQKRLKKRRRNNGIMLILAAGSAFRVGSTRLLWSRDKSQHWFENIVMHMDNDQFIENFRVDKTTFQYLVTELSNVLRREDTPMRKGISVEMHIACSLWKLAGNTGLRETGHQFGLGKSTVCEIMQEFCSAVNTILMPQLIQSPNNPQQLRRIVDGFREKSGFPQVGGLIDGSHIPIHIPRKDLCRDYYNRLGYYSIVMQAIVDHEYCFLDIFIGWPGSVHDARIFRNSPAGIKASEGQLYTQIHGQTQEIGGIDIPVVLLGDAAYPLSTYLMKPYVNPIQQQRSYNYRLSSTRMGVENAFGRCKGRWHILQKRNDSSLDNVIKQTMCCCVLHNLCERRGVPFPEAWLRQEDINNDPVPDNNAEGAADIREALREFCQHL